MSTFILVHVAPTSRIHIRYTLGVQQHFELSAPQSGAARWQPKEGASQKYSQKIAWDIPGIFFPPPDWMPESEVAASRGR